MNHTPAIAPASAPSFRERIAARRAQFVAPAAAALALGALATSDAEAAIYVVASPSAANLQFDPLDGSSAPGSYVTSPENPIFINACNGAFVMTDPSLAGGSDFAFVTPAVDEWANLQLLGAGVTINASSAFYDVGQYEYSTNPAAYDGVTPYYLGFRYTNQGVGANETYYGWIEFTMSDPSLATVTRYAIGGAGETIVTGQDVSSVPEPSSAAALVGALAFGATVARRRRR